MTKQQELVDSFASVAADIVEMGGTKALMAAALTLVEIVAAEMPDYGRIYFLMEVLRAFADGTGGKVVVSGEPPAVNAGGLH